MQLGERLIGKSVISANDGRVIGAVKELYLDRNLEILTAIRLGGDGFLGLGGEGLFGRKIEVITRDDILLFGIDVILVKDSWTVTDGEQVPGLGQWLERNDLKGRAVDTPGGTKIGTIGDVIFDGDGRILGFRLSRIFVSGPLAQKEVVAREVMIDPGNDDEVLTIDLGRAEHQELSLARVARDIRAREEQPEPESEPVLEEEPEPERERFIQTPAD